MALTNNDNDNESNFYVFNEITEATGRFEMVKKMLH